MIKDNIDFEYSIEQLNKDLDLNIFMQEEILDSDKINTTFTSIEKNLNTLYEKTRHLENAIEYIKTFLSIKIDEYSNNLNSIINSINDIKKSSKNMGYIEYSVPFVQNVFSIQDRNKNYKVEPTLLKETTIDDLKTSILLLNSRANVNYKYNSLSRKCEQIPYDENLNDLISDKEYKVTYIEERPINEGITETITIYLSKPCEVNELNIESVNSNIENVKYVYANGVEEETKKYVTGIEAESRVCTHIKFDLKCKNYNTVVYELDTDLITDDIFNYIKTIEHPKSDVVLDKLSMEVLVSRTETDFNNKVTYTAYKKAPEKITKLTMYVYNFGIDKLDINRIEQYEDGYFISDPIALGDFNENEYLQLQVEDVTGEASSIEYYILDGDIEIPLMPINYDYINNERIFPEQDLRFVIDFDIYGDGLKQIKKDGINVPISLEDAKVQYDGRYSADYLPIFEYYKYTPLNNTIRIKAIIRTFGDTISTIPYIKNINIRKFGGNTLWTTLY